MKRKIKRIAILASGNGSTMQSVIDAISNKQLKMQIKMVISDNHHAYALKRAKNNNIPTYVLKSSTYESRDMELYNILKGKKIDMIVLLGYLKLIRSKVINKYTIINTHPSLIPHYCGKGMHGMKVHDAVVKNHEKETGVTVHFVNEVYDDGKIIWQTKVPVYEEDTKDDVAARVQLIEKAQIINILKAFSEGKIDLDKR